MDPFPIACWCERLLSMCKTQFGKRLCCFGLQGSFRRGEATPASDIDIVLVLNALTVDDLTAYHALLAQMPQGERACGFVCGKQELSHWAPSELFTLYHDTKVLYGSLGFLLPLFSPKDVALAVKLGAGNLYHACCHSFLFENAAQNLPALYKQAFFLIQAHVYAQSGVFEPSKQALLKHCSPFEHQILMQSIALSQGAGVSGFGQELSLYYQSLLTLSAQLLQESSHMG